MGREILRTRLWRRPLLTWWPLWAWRTLWSNDVLCHVLSVGSEHGSKHSPVILTAGVLPLLLGSCNGFHGSQHSFMLFIMPCINHVWVAQGRSKKPLAKIQGSR